MHFKLGGRYCFLSSSARVNRIETVKPFPSFFWEVVGYRWIQPLALRRDPLFSSTTSTLLLLPVGAPPPPGELMDTDEDRDEDRSNREGRRPASPMGPSLRIIVPVGRGAGQPGREGIIIGNTTLSRILIPSTLARALQSYGRKHIKNIILPQVGSLAIKIKTKQKQNR